jgi:hypothetical protein
MKPTEEELNQNISRLVKLTRDSHRPSQVFTYTLINDALQELQSHRTEARKEGLVTIQKKTLLCAIAALVLVLISINLVSKRTSHHQEPIDRQNTLARGELVPLAITLPKPVFASTPANLSAIPNLETPLGTPRPAFLSPKGTINVALGKPVRSSSGKPLMGNLAMITDGNKEASEDNSIVLKPDATYSSVTIDLEGSHEVYAILFWHDHKVGRVFNDVIVQASNDPDFVQGVKTLFNNDHDNTSGFGMGMDKNYLDTYEGKLVDAKGHQARYVRLCCQGNNLNGMNQYLEVEVYGKPIPNLKTFKHRGTPMPPQSF